MIDLWRQLMAFHGLLHIHFRLIHCLFLSRNAIEYL